MPSNTATPTSKPTLPPSPTPTPTYAQGDITGKALDDIPGTRIGRGSKVNSVVDVNTKPDDVYSIDLVAGQEVEFTIDAPDGSLQIILFNPGSKSVNQQNSRAWTKRAFTGRSQFPFPPAISGTYYLAVEPYGSAQRYTLTVK